MYGCHIAPACSWHVSIKQKYQSTGIYLPGENLRPVGSQIGNERFVNEACSHPDCSSTPPSPRVRPRHIGFRRGEFSLRPFSSAPPAFPLPYPTPVASALACWSDLASAARLHSASATGMILRARLQCPAPARICGYHCLIRNHYILWPESGAVRTQIQAKQRWYRTNYQQNFAGGTLYEDFYLVK